MIFHPSPTKVKSPGGHGSAVHHRETNPCRGDEGLVYARKSGKSKTSTTAKITTKEDTRTAQPAVLNRGAGCDRRRHAAYRDARSERGGPFPAEAEPFAGDKVDHGPLDQIGFYDRGNGAQEQRCRETELARDRYGEEGAEDHDSDLV